MPSVLVFLQVSYLYLFICRLVRFEFVRVDFPEFPDPPEEGGMGPGLGEFLEGSGVGSGWLPVVDVSSPEFSGPSVSGSS